MLSDGTVLDIDVPAGALFAGTSLMARTIDLGEGSADPGRAADILSRLSKAAGLPEGETLPAGQVKAYEIFFYDGAAGEVPHIQPAKGVTFTLRNLQIEGDTLDVYAIPEITAENPDPAANKISKASTANPAEGPAVVTVTDNTQFDVIAVVGNVMSEEEAEETKDTEEEIEYPPFVLENVPVEGTPITISVDAPEGAFPEGIQMKAFLKETPEAVLEAANAELAYEAAQENAGQEGSVESTEVAGAEVTQDDVVTFDISFYLPEDPDTEIEPLVPISVSFGNLTLEGDTLEVYHSDESPEGEVQVEKVLDGVENTDVLTVEGLDRFSEYTIMGVKNLLGAVGDSSTGVLSVTNAALTSLEQNDDGAYLYGIHENADQVFNITVPSSAMGNGQLTIEIDLPAYGMQFDDNTVTDLLSKEEVYSATFTQNAYGYNTHLKVVLSDALTENYVCAVSTKYAYLTDRQCRDIIDYGWQNTEALFTLSSSDGIINDSVSFPMAVKYGQKEPNAFEVAVHEIDSASTYKDQLNERYYYNSGNNGSERFGLKLSDIFRMTIPMVDNQDTNLIEITGIRMYAPDDMFTVDSFNPASSTAALNPPGYLNGDRRWTSYFNVSSAQFDEQGRTYYQLTPRTRLFNNGTASKTDQYIYSELVSWKVSEDLQGDSIYTADGLVITYKLPGSEEKEMKPDNSGFVVKTKTMRKADNFSYGEANAYQRLYGYGRYKKYVMDGRETSTAKYVPGDTYSQFNFIRINNPQTSYAADGTEVRNTVTGKLTETYDFPEEFSVTGFKAVPATDGDGYCSQLNSVEYTVLHPDGTENVYVADLSRKTFGYSDWPAASFSGNLREGDRVSRVVVKWDKINTYYSGGVGSCFNFTVDEEATGLLQIKYSGILDAEDDPDAVHTWKTDTNTEYLYMDYDPGLCPDLIKASHTTSQYTPPHHLEDQYMEIGYLWLKSAAGGYRTKVKDPEFTIDLRLSNMTGLSDPTMMLSGEMTLHKVMTDCIVEYTVVDKNGNERTGSYRTPEQMDASLRVTREMLGISEHEYITSLKVYKEGILDFKEANVVSGNNRFAQLISHVGVRLLTEAPDGTPILEVGGNYTDSPYNTTHGVLELLGTFKHRDTCEIAAHHENGQSAAREGAWTPPMLRLATKRPFDVTTEISGTADPSVRQGSEASEKINISVKARSRLLYTSKTSTRWLLQCQWEIPEAIYVELRDPQFEINLEDADFLSDLAEHNMTVDDVSIITVDGKRWLKLSTGDAFVKLAKETTMNSTTSNSMAGYKTEDNSIRLAFHVWSGAEVGDHAPIGEVWYDLADQTVKYDGSPASEYTVINHLNTVADEHKFRGDGSNFMLWKGDLSTVKIAVLQNQLTGVKVLPGKNGIIYNSGSVSFYTDEAENLTAATTINTPDLKVYNYTWVEKLPRKGETIPYTIIGEDGESQTGEKENEYDLFLTGPCTAYNSTLPSDSEVIFAYSKDGVNFVDESAISSDEWEDYQYVKTTINYADEKNSFEMRYPVRAEKDAIGKLKAYIGGEYQFEEEAGNVTKGNITPAEYVYLDYPVRGIVWYEKTEDGRMGEQEEPAEDINLTLYGPDGTKIDSAQTDENGRFELKTWIAEAGQVIKIDVPEHTRLTIKSEALPEEEELDSDFDPETEEVTLNSVKDRSYINIGAGLVEMLDVVVTKNWEDNEDQDGIRPEEVELQLTVNGETEKDPVTVNEDTNWTARWTDLNKYVDGQEAEFGVQELGDIDGYIVSDVVSSDSNDEYTRKYEITNTHTSEVISIIVTKQWDDADDQDGLRPNEITVNLLADDEIVGTKTFGPPEGDDGEAQADWTCQFENVPKYRDHGTEIQYSVTEEDIEGYTAVIDGFLIRNIHIPEKINVSVEKKWDDSDDQDGLRPELVHVTLVGNEKPVTSAVLSAANGWKYEFKDLNRYENGEEISYSIEETEVSGYDHQIEIGEVMEPDPEDENGEAIIPVTITNTHEPETVDIPVQKVWDDKDDQDGARPDYVILRLLVNGAEMKDDETGEWLEDYYVELDGSKAEEYDFDVENENVWPYIFEGMPKYDHGHPIRYTVIEDVPSGYSFDIERNAVINTYTPGKTSVTVVKKWDDNFNQDGIRPDSVTVNLLAGEGEDAKVVKTAILTEADGWRYTFTDLDVKKDGEDIVYTVKEELDEDSPYVEGKIEGNAKTAFIIPNSYDPETISVTAKKAWEDNDDQDGARPEEVTVRLFANGIFRTEETLSESNEWTFTWSDLPKYDKGSEILYTVTEDAVSGYATETTPSADEDGLIFTFTNSYTPGETSVTVTKSWDDEDDYDGLRPESVEVKLLANDEAIAVEEGEEDPYTVTLSEANRWTYTWTNLPEKADGEDIVYTVEETPVEGYNAEDDQPAITGDATTGYVITNIHEMEKTSISGEKVWDDNEDELGIRPFSITVSLYADGEFVASRTVTADNYWAFDFGELPVYAKGSKEETEIVYTIVEDAVEGYTATYATDDEAEGEITFTVTNTPVTTTSVSVKKVWDDEGNRDGVRPDSVLVDLMAGDEVIGTAGLSAANGWYYVWEGLDKEDADGNEIKYTVAEQTDDDGKVGVYTAGDAEELDAGAADVNYEITNTYEVARKNIYGEVIWDDLKDEDGIRPSSVIITLYADGVEVASKMVQLSADAEDTETPWPFSFLHLPVYKAGSAEEMIDYEITQNAVYDYKTTIVKGTKAAQTEDTSGDATEAAEDESLKTADGADPGTNDNTGNDGSGEAADSGDTTEAGDPGADGSADTGTGTGDGSDQASSTVEDDYFTVTNIHRPERVTISGQKIWEDDSNRDGVRPESITVYLYADGSYVASQELTAKNADPDNADVWNYEFTDLKKYNSHNETIRYSVSEKAVKDYTMSLNGFNITNKHTPGKTFVSVIKVWSDNANAKKTRPESITVRLYADGKEIAHQTLSSQTGWFHVFTDLDTKNGGKEIAYTITEDDVTGYESVITGSASEGYMINNKLTETPEKPEDKEKEKEKETEKEKEKEKETEKESSSNKTTTTGGGPGGAPGGGDGGKIAPVKTGDDTPIGLYVTLLVIGLAALTGVILAVRKRRRS